MVAQKRTMIGSAPIKTSDGEADTVALGQAAWKRRKADRATWGDYKAIGRALLFGRQECLRKAKTNRPRGRKYTVFFHVWIENHNFDDMDSADRSKLLHIMDNLDAVEAYLKSLAPAKREKLNHPSSIWRAWKCKRRGNSGKPRDKDQSAKSDANKAEANDGVDDEESEKVRWQRGLMLRASKAIGDAELHDFWALPEPPDAGLIKRVRKAAEVWTSLANYLDSIRYASPDEMTEAREVYAKAQRDDADYKARKAAKWRDKAEKALRAAA